MHLCNYLHAALTGVHVLPRVVWLRRLGAPQRRSDMLRGSEAMSVEPNPTPRPSASLNSVSNREPIPAAVNSVQVSPNCL
jgi:hypothetical protein